MAGLDPRAARALLVRLARAQSEADVGKILSDPLLAGMRWVPLGDDDNNYSTVANQQSDPVNALCEKPINSIDHVLLRRCREAGDDPESAAAPGTMREAVERYLGVPGGDASRLADADQKRLAENVLLAADGSRQSPNIVVADRGEGQDPRDFGRTLLSLHRGNKKRIKFVQGKYNMGGTGVLPFCGKMGYELVASRRAPGLADPSSPSSADWGFTLVREKPDVPDSYKTTWYEYLAAPGDDCVLRAGSPPLDILPITGPLECGCYIKMFEYYLPKPSIVTDRLWGALNSRLYSPAIPFIVHEARQCYDISKESLRTMVMRGNASRVQRDARGNVHRRIRLRPTLRGLGRREIDVTVFKHATMVAGKHRRNPAADFRDESEAVVLTQNGQAHAKISLARLRTATRLASLAPYMMVHVDLTGVPPRMAKMFLASRDRARGSADFDRLREGIFEDIREDDDLLALDEEYRRLDERMSVRDGSMDDAIRGLIKRNKSFARLLGPGSAPADGGRAGGAGGAPTKGGSSGGAQASEEFKPSHVPTYLEVRAGPDDRRGAGSGRASSHHRKIPSSGRPAYIYFETDAPNGYTERRSGGGSIGVSHSEAVESTPHAPFDGMVKVKVAAKGGDYETPGSLTVSLARPDAEPLTCVVQLHLGPEEEKGGGGGRGRRKGGGGGGVDAPRFEWVVRDRWGEWGWNEKTVSAVAGNVVRVNRNCKHLEDFKKGRKRTEAERIDARFGLCVYLASVALHRSIGDSEEHERVHEKAMAAVAMTCLSSSHDVSDEDLAGIVRAGAAQAAEAGAAEG